VTSLERRYPRFDGLNLSWETLEGLVKHNGPLLREGSGEDAGRRLAFGIRAVQDGLDLELHTFASLEAQVAAISDDIAYDCHDLEDGLRAGLLDLTTLEAEPLTGGILAAIRSELPALEPARAMHELIRRMISLMIHDVLAQTSRRIEAAGVASADEARRAGAGLVGFSAELAGRELALKAFLFANLYRHDAVMRPVHLAETVIADLFHAFSAEPRLMPEEWGHGLDRGDAFGTARRVADYIAGMTDRYAISEHRRLFDATPDLG
jgi:dGTPase